MAILGTLGTGAAATLAAGNIGSGLLSLGNGSSGWSNQNSQGSGWELGGSNSASSAYDWSNAYGYGTSDSFGEGWQESWSDAYSENYGRTFGREASAQDILNAREANAVQRDLWSDQAAYNAQQAALDRQFQAYMSNTAYQRAVQDLRAAGLNPILAVGNMGASTPQGATASAGLASASKANAYAEQTSGGYSRSNSGSSAYNYNKSTSRNENWSQSRGESSSYSRGWNAGHNESTMEAASRWSNNAKDIAKSLTGAVKSLFNGASSGFKAAVENAPKNSQYSGYTDKWGHRRDMYGNIVD